MSIAIYGYKFVIIEDMRRFCTSDVTDGRNCCRANMKWRLFTLKSSSFSGVLSNCNESRSACNDACRTRPARSAPVNESVSAASSSKSTSFESTGCFPCCNWNIFRYLMTVSKISPNVKRYYSIVSYLCLGLKYF